MVATMKMTKEKKINEKSTENKKNNMVLNVLGIILCVILVPILICNLTLIVKGMISDEVPTFFGYAPLILGDTAGSMEGGKEDIKAGDLVISKKLSADAFSKENVEDLNGKIISFYFDDMNAKGESIVSVNTHRIVEVVYDEEGNFSHFRTKGDFYLNDIDENLVYQEDVIGIFQCRITGLGKFALFLQKPIGIICFIGLPFIAFILYDIIRRWLAAKKEAGKNQDLLDEIKRLKEQIGEKSSLEGGESK